MRLREGEPGGCCRGLRGYGRFDLAIGILAFPAILLLLVVSAPGWVKANAYLLLVWAPALLNCFAWFLCVRLVLQLLKRAPSRTVA